jgi:hypothetical protein
MSEIPGTGFADRLKAAAEARKALRSNFRPKPTVTDPNFQTRAEARAAELVRVRQARADAKAAKLQRAASAAEAVLDAKRGERKERKALSKAEAKAKRDARYAARKARA